ncbi:MAG: hypothetical protein IKR95_00320 [Oscillospiraceae bacterium]|nr:hypothetical protein [Oscillospiraceae bacterium]
MTNRERYKNAAELVKPSGSLDTMAYVEEQIMNRKKTRRPLRTLITVCACVVLVLALCVTAYAADLGGVRHSIKVWLHGDVTEVTIEQVGEYEYLVTYPDGSTRGTGGAVITPGGKARAMTMDEIEEHLISEVVCESGDDGRYWLYVRDHKIDITDQITGNGYAQVKVKDGVLPDYFTVVWHDDGGYGIESSHTGFSSPESVRRSTGVE